MYDAPQAVTTANGHLWSAIRDRLRDLGEEAPDHLDRQTLYNEAWLKPDLLLAQACGFPYVKLLRGRVRLVGTPTYSFAGGRGADRSSFVVVRDRDPATTIGELAGRRVAINEHLSNSGMNLLRAFVAPLASEGRFFGEIVLTGGHLASLAAVSDGRADVASIDSVTWGLQADHAPGRLAGLRILAETTRGPGLPLITRGDASDHLVDRLRKAIGEAIADPANAKSIETLGLTGLAFLGDADYERLADLERQAVASGYPAIA